MARLLRGILMVGVGMLLLSPPRLTTASAPPTLIRLVSSTPEAVVLVFTLPDYTLPKVSTQGQVFVRPQVAGLVPGVEHPVGAEPGAPQLLQTGVLIGLPPVQSLLDIHDVPNLRNDQRWPVVLHRWILRWLVVCLQAGLLRWTQRWAVCLRTQWRWAVQPHSRR